MLAEPLCDGCVDDGFVDGCVSDVDEPCDGLFDVVPDGVVGFVEPPCGFVVDEPVDELEPL